MIKMKKGLNELDLIMIQALRDNGIEVVRVPAIPKVLKGSTSDGSEQKANVIAKSEERLSKPIVKQIGGFYGK